MGIHYLCFVYIKAFALLLTYRSSLRLMCLVKHRTIICSPVVEAGLARISLKKVSLQKLHITSIYTHFKTKTASQSDQQTARPPTSQPTSQLTAEIRDQRTSNRQQTTDHCFAFFVMSNFDVGSWFFCMMCDIHTILAQRSPNVNKNQDVFRFRRSGFGSLNLDSRIRLAPTERSKLTDDGGRPGFLGRCCSSKRCFRARCCPSSKRRFGAQGIGPWI